MDEVGMAELKVGDRIMVKVTGSDCGDYEPGQEFGPFTVASRAESGWDLAGDDGIVSWWSCPEHWIHKVGDAVNHPAHYNTHGVEVIDIIESRYADNYHLANAVKYLLRAPYKGAMIEDIRKCQWYINRWLERQ